MTSLSAEDESVLARSRSYKQAVLHTCADLQIDVRENEGSPFSTNSATSTSGVLKWMRLSNAVKEGKFSSWDNIDLPQEKQGRSTLDVLDRCAIQDDYGVFMTSDEFSCGKEVKWTPLLYAKLAKDKSNRGALLRAAKEFGDSLTGMQDRHVTVIYNPVGGGGKAKRIVAHLVVPILQLAKLKHTVMPTKYRRHAVELVKQLDINTTDGIVVCGGDGLVHEVITGYFLHEHLELLKNKVTVGLVPCGTANAMANAVHTHPNNKQIMLVGRAVLAIAKGSTRDIDVLKCIQENSQESEELKGDEPIETYALSCVGWGMAGAVALKADKLRWIPGQKSARYDIAGFVSLISDWPIVDEGVLEYREWDGSTHGSEWKTKNISLVNMLATNIARQGKKYPVAPGMEPDNGMVALLYVNSAVSRGRVIQLGMGMKNGKWLGKQKDVTTIKCKEFKITPTNYKSPYLIDGDPHDVSKIHVTVMPRALRLFALPAEDQSGTISSMWASCKRCPCYCC